MIFSIEEARRLVARVAHQGEVETFDCAADAACSNPVCRCRTTSVAMRPPTPGLPTRTVTFDLDARDIDEAFRKRASADDLVFGERLLSAMDGDDFDLLSRLHYAAKNRLSEKAHPSEIKVRFDFDEVEGSSLLQSYNDILPFGDTFRITLDGTDYSGATRDGSSASQAATASPLPPPATDRGAAPARRRPDRPAAASRGR